YRGAGRPEAAYFIERAMDMLAARLTLDPADVRKRNFIPPDKFPYDTALGNSYDSGEYARALDHALAKSGYPALRKEQEAARAQGRLVGIGLASYVEICGFERAESSDLVLADGRFSVRGVPDRSVTWQQVAAAAKGSLHSKEDFQTGNGMLFPFGAHVAMVEVDRDTGQPRILRYMSVDDAGFLINPLLVQGQVHGGLAQGIGQALWEEAAFDEGGQLLSSSLMDYALPKTI